MGAPVKKKSAFTKAASIPAQQQSENTDPRISGLIFSTLRPPSKTKLNKKLKTLKRHLTLSECLRNDESRLNFSQEDVNGEKLTVRKWWAFWCRFFHGLVPTFSRFTPIFSRFVRDINCEKKNISLLMIFFTVSFSRFAPS